MAGLFAKATSMLSSLPIESVVGTCFGQFDKDKSGFVEVGYAAGRRKALCYHNARWYRPPRAVHPA
jgi:hypothetical protein